MDNNIKLREKLQEVIEKKEKFIYEEDCAEILKIFSKNYGVIDIVL